MSEAVLANLPRFDVPGEAPRLSALQSLRFDTLEADAAPVPDSDKPDASTTSDDGVVANEAQPAEPVAAPDAEPAAFEAMLTALSETSDRLERKSREQVVTTIQAIATKLFPELSRRFMVEEIGRHLPQLIPVSAATIIIHTPPSLMENLRQVVDRTSALSPRCTLVPADSSIEGRVDISWQTGGLNFDFNGLLDACLAQLGPAQTKYGSAK